MGTLVIFEPSAFKFLTKRYFWRDLSTAQVHTTWIQYYQIPLFWHLAKFLFYFHFFHHFFGLNFIKPPILDLKRKGSKLSQWHEINNSSYYNFYTVNIANSRSHQVSQLGLHQDRLISYDFHTFNYCKYHVTGIILILFALSPESGVLWNLNRKSGEKIEIKEKICKVSK